MAYDERLATRVRESLSSKTDFSEKKMFGGLAFMVRGNMSIGIRGESVMARIGPDQHEEMLSRPHVRPMDFTGRPMVGYVYVDAPGLARSSDLDDVVSRCLSFNATLPAK